MNKQTKPIDRNDNAQLHEIRLHMDETRYESLKKLSEKVKNIIPTIYREMTSDQENDSKWLYKYYQGSNNVEQATINNMCIALCGYSFETILEKCGIKEPEPFDINDIPF